MLPVTRPAPGVVSCKAAGMTVFGHAGQSRPAKAEYLESVMMEAGLDVRYEPDVKQRVWQKVAFNAGMNAVCALTHSTPGLVAELDSAKSIVRAIAAEVAEVADKLGVQIDLQAVYQTIDFACEKHANHRPSMLQDLLAAKPTEIDALNGAVAQYAAETGVSAPLNTLFANLVKLAEKGHAQL